MKKKVMAGFMAGMMALGAMAGTVYADVTDYSDAVPAEVKGTDDVSVLEDEYTAKEKIATITSKIKRTPYSS